MDNSVNEAVLERSLVVYVANVAYDYEGEALVGVFSTLDKAKAALDGYRQGDDQVIRAEEVDGDTVLTVERRSSGWEDGKRAYGGWDDD